MEVAGESVGADLCVGPNTFCCGSRSRADTQVRPYAGWKVFRTTQASGAQRSVCGAGAREWAGIGAGITPKEPSTLDNPSVSLRLTAPFTQGSLALRGTGVRAAEVVGPYGTKRKPAATARGSALSAERVAGQIRVLPDDLFVQHGVLGSEV